MFVKFGLLLPPWSSKHSTFPLRFHFYHNDPNLVITCDAIILMWSAQGFRLSQLDVKCLPRDLRWIDNKIYEVMFVQFDYLFIVWPLKVPFL